MASFSYTSKPGESEVSQMTEKQKIFADEYLIDLNATRAYKVAYPRVKNDDIAAANASRLLRNAKVAAYISERMQERQKRTEVTQVPRELKNWLRSPLPSYRLCTDLSWKRDPDGHQ